MVRKTKPTKEDMLESKELVQYHIYDLFDPDAPDALFLERFNLAVEPNDAIHIVRTNTCATQEDLDSLYSDYTEDGYEGQMIRNNTPYENKRSKNLLKRKEFITEEFDVVSVLEGAGTWAGYAKHFELELGDGRIFKSGVRGTQEVLKVLLLLSHKTNFAFLYKATLAVEIYVKLGTINSSFSFICKAVKIESKVDVPLFMAIAYLAFVN